MRGTMPMAIVMWGIMPMAMSLTPGAVRDVPRRERGGPLVEGDAAEHRVLRGARRVDSDDEFELVDPPRQLDVTWNLPAPRWVRIAEHWNRGCVMRARDLLCV